MRKLYFFLLLILSTPAFSQPGIVTTIGGGGPSVVDGVPATDAVVGGGGVEYNNPICVDIAGNVYISEGNKVKKVVAATGLIYTVAGGGVSVADGVPATTASLNIHGSEGGDFYIDLNGNLYITEVNKIRRIDAITHIITTVASGFTQATDVILDHHGNLLVTDWDASKVYRVDIATGVKTVVAGNGIMASSGDGGPATSASVYAPGSVAVDIDDNIYISQWDGHLRKVNASTGVITTLSTTAHYARLCSDNMSNIYMAHNSWTFFKKMDANTGIFENVSGSDWGGAGYNDEMNNVPISKIHATARNVCASVDGSIYYISGPFSRVVRKINSYCPGITSSQGKFTVYNNKYCYGINSTVGVTAYSPGMKLVNHYGDGAIDTSVISPSSGAGAYTHVYSVSGSYVVKHYLYSGLSLLDSISYPFVYDLCRTMQVKLFYDGNVNCNKDSSFEPFIYTPSLITVDSNGVGIDTLSIMSGLSYNAYGNPGDVYSFRFASFPIGFVLDCPAIGIIRDTVSASINTPIKYFAFSCGGPAGYDFGIYTSVMMGPHLFRGQMLVNNSFCSPLPAVVKMKGSNKFNYEHSWPISASAYSATSANWDVNLSSLSPPNLIYFESYTPPGPDLSIGDTVNSIYEITPVSGDANPLDNIIVRVDTVKSAFDPNYIEVSPSGCIPKLTSTELTYTVGFENTGNDTAHNIYVLDTLPYGLDFSSFRVLAASAAMDIHKYTAGPYTVIKFDFPNIMLPDSSHHGLCHGMFVYKIKTIQGLQRGITIPNRVGIYFDTNPVVMTNSTYNEIDCAVTSVPVISCNERHDVLLYPNPATDELTIEAASEIFSSLAITNTVGQQLMQQSVSRAKTTVDVHALPPGIYYITLTGVQGNETRKFVKW